MSYFEDVIEPNLYKTPKRHGGYNPPEYTKADLPTIGRDFPWCTNDCVRLKIGEMTDSHLINAHNLLGSRIGLSSEKTNDFIYYGLLRSEINSRNINKDKSC